MADLLITRQGNPLHFEGSFGQYTLQAAVLLVFVLCVVYGLPSWLEVRVQGVELDQDGG